MRIMTDRAVAFLDRLMCDHSRRQIRFVAIAACRLHRLLQERRLHAGVRRMTIRTGKFCGLQVVRLREFFGRMTTLAKFVAWFDQKRLFIAAVGVVASVARAVNDW